MVPASAIQDIAADGAGFAGFAAWLDMTPAFSDVLVLPDPDSMTILPWKKEVAWLACNPMMGGVEVDQAPRNVLRKQNRALAEKGLHLITGVETEWHLVTPDGKSLADASDTQSKPCYDQAGLMRQYDYIAELVECLEELGWGPYQCDHEDANGQFEINWGPSDALVTADRHGFFKYMAQAIAEKHGMRATFMPKPFINLSGNGCHVHHSLWKGDAPVFEDRSDSRGLDISQDGYHWLGGLLKHAQGMCALTNPTVNSYKRINAPATASGATWSPNTVSYTGNNRTHMVRVPSAPRFEFRLGDGAANPYLLQAALIAAGLDGLNNKIEPGEPSHENMYAPTPEAIAAAATMPKLPLYLLDALRDFEADTALQASLGSEFSEAFLKLKYNQWNEYSTHLTQWERDTTLDC